MDNRIILKLILTLCSQKFIKIIELFQIKFVCHIKKHRVSFARTAQLMVEIKEYHSENHMESMGKMQSVFKC
jgi:hypothetical protein